MENLSEIKSYRDFMEEYLKDLDDGELLNLYNEYNEYDQIYYNDEDFLDEFFSTPTEAVRAVYYGDYKYSDRYVKFNGYGNLDSADFLDDFIYLFELIDNLKDGEYLLDEYNDYLYDKEQDFYNDLEDFEKLPMVERLKILKNIKIIEQENQDKEKNDFFDSIRNEVEKLLEDDFPEIFDIGVEQIDLIIEKLNLKQNKNQEIEL